MEDDDHPPAFKILMFPWLAHGHVFPFLQLAKALSKTQNFRIYFCSTSVNLHSVKHALSKHDTNTTASSSPSIHLVQLQLPIPSEQLPPHNHTTKNIPPHLMPMLLEAFQKSSPDFANILKNLNPDLLIYDGFQPWAAKQAAALGIPAVLFSTSGAASLSYYHHLHSHKSPQTYPFPEIYLHGYQMRNLTAQAESIKVEDADDGFAFGILKLSSEIVLMKSSRVVEDKYMEYLSKLCHRRIVPVGPLVSDVMDDGDSEEIIRWLDDRSRSSTLYISFGSENYLSKDEMIEIAKGLELSDVDFIWVVRSPPGAEEAAAALLEGFIGRTKGRGRVCQGWAPQAWILAHPSVAGFMSHCGWGSVMESIYFSVPVLAVPLKLDQPLNCRLVVERGLGVEVARDGEGKFDGEGVAKAINELMAMVGKKGSVGEMSQKVREEEGNAFPGAVQDLTKLCRKK